MKDHMMSVRCLVCKAFMENHNWIVDASKKHGQAGGVLEMGGKMCF